VQATCCSPLQSDEPAHASLRSLLKTANPASELDECAGFRRFATNVTAPPEEPVLLALPESEGQGNDVMPDEASGEPLAECATAVRYETEPLDFVAAQKFGDRPVTGKWK